MQSITIRLQMTERLIPKSHSFEIINFFVLLCFFFSGVRPFACPHCEKKFRTSGHRKTHIASHFKQCELRRLHQQRKPGKVRTGKNNVPVAEIPLQEPILITDLGKR